MNAEIQNIRRLEMKMGLEDLRTDPHADCRSFEGDVLDVLALIPDGTVDMVLTDLPYPTKERHRSWGTTTRLSDSKKSSNPWFGVLSISQLIGVLGEFHRVMKPNTYAFIYVDDDTDKLLSHFMGVIEDLDTLVDSKTSRAPRDAHGWFNWWTPATWVKVTKDSHKVPGGKLAPGMGWHGQQTTEKILILEKGKRKLGRFPNALPAARPRPQPKGATLKATTPKPEGIATVLVEAATEPGDLVLDPFIGSGTHAKGILDAGRKALVADVSLALFKDYTHAAYGWEYTL